MFMETKISFKVFKRIGILNSNQMAVTDERYEDATSEREWYISPDGSLMYVTEDIDEPIKEAEESYFYIVEKV